MSGITIREGEKEEGPGRVIMTNTKVIKQVKTHDTITEEREKMDFVNKFEKISGQSPEQKKFLRDHSING